MQKQKLGPCTFIFSGFSRIKAPTVECRFDLSRPIETDLYSDSIQWSRGTNQNLICIYSIYIFLILIKYLIKRCPLLTCLSIAAGSCLPQTVGLLRLYALLPRCDSVLANQVQRRRPLCKPRPLSHQAHLCFLLHASCQAEVLLCLDTR